MGEDLVNYEDENDDHDEKWRYLIDDDVVPFDLAKRGLVLDNVVVGGDDHVELAVCDLVLVDLLARGRTTLCVSHEKEKSVNSLARDDDATSSLPQGSFVFPPRTL